MHLTREGRKLQELVTPLFNQMESGIREIQGRMDLVQGTVKIGISPSLCDYLLVPHLRTFNLKYPEIRVELILLPDYGLEELLKRDSIDFAFIIEFMDRDLFQVAPCIEFNETLVVTPTYIKQWSKHSGSRAPEYAYLVHAQFVDFGSDLPNLKHWLRKNTKRDRQILESKRASVVVEDYDSVKKLVSEGGPSGNVSNCIETPQNQCSMQNELL